MSPTSYRTAPPRVTLKDPDDSIAPPTMSLTSPSRPTFADIQDAARQIAGVAHRTPVVTSRTINDRTGAQVHFKCENLQRAGAFKFRGAYNAMSRLSSD